MVSLMKIQFQILQKLLLFWFRITCFCNDKSFLKFFFANHDTKTPFYISLISVFLNILISVYFFKSIGFIIIPIATTISSWFNLIILFLLFKKKIYLVLMIYFIKRFFKIIFSSSTNGIIF